MNSTRLLGIYREQIFSPGKIQDDSAVLDATLREMSDLGWEVAAIAAESLSGSAQRPSHVLSMAQSDRVLDLLEDWTRKGTAVVNSVSSIRSCYRKPLTHLLQNGGIDIPASRILPIEGVDRTAFPCSGRVWLKRGDVHAIQEGDVVPVDSDEDLTRALSHFRSQGVRDVLMQEHVEGRVVKFYGVGHDRFFRAYLAETGEDITDRVERLLPLARRAAKVVGLEVYGGDAVLMDGEEATLIDLNDWPSFSRCYRPAAQSIARYLTDRGRHPENWRNTP